MEFPVSKGEHTLHLGPVTLNYYVKKESCYLLLIETIKEERGKGFARKVLESFLHKMNQIKLPVFLVIEPQDESTDEDGLRIFYSSLGFVPRVGSAWKYTPD